MLNYLEMKRDEILVLLRMVPFPFKISCKGYFKRAYSVGKLNIDTILYICKGIGGDISFQDPFRGYLFGIPLEISVCSILGIEMGIYFYDSSSLILI